jgi:heme-degrading monooxygenase HmoA
MVLEIADIHILPGKQAEFEAAIEHGLRTVHTRAQGMRGYRLDRGVESPERYVLQVRWDTVEDHMVSYREGPLSPEFRALVTPFFARPPVFQHFEQVVEGGGWVSSGPATGR